MVFSCLENAAFWNSTVNLTCPFSVQVAAFTTVILDFAVSVAVTTPFLVAVAVHSELLSFHT